MARRPAIHVPVRSRRAPRPLGHASPAMIAASGQSLWVGAQLPLEMPSGKLSQAPFARQAGLALAHLQALVSDAGFAMDEVVQVSVWLVDLAQLDAFDGVYRTFFLGQGPPARSVVQVAALPHAARVAVACQAVKPAAAATAAAAEPEPEYDDDY